METTTETATTTQAEAFAAAAQASAEADAQQRQATKPPRAFTEKMPCQLSAQELADRGGQLADLYAESDRLEGERKNQNDRFKAEIELVDQRVRDLAGVLKNRTEMRDVELVEEFIFATNTVRISRADTKEVVRERAMTRGERQLRLPLQEAPRKNGKASNGGDGAHDEAEAVAADADGTEIKDPVAVLGPDNLAHLPGGKPKRGRRKSS